VRGGIAQSFATSLGTRYAVTFDLAGNPNQLPRVKRLRVSAGEDSAEFTFDATGRNGRNMGWLPQRWTFVAREARTTLEFQSLTTSPQTGFGAAIDNVAVVAEAALLAVTESQDEIQVQLGSEVLFDTGRFDLKAAATAALDALARLVAAYPDAPIVIEGHTDSVGTASANQALSERRAAAVKAWLVAHGITGERILARGLGQTVSVASNDTADGRQKNRRVEIRVHKTPPGSQ
jgi:outer membrane protein OmpA-like peptidoglycan-associated protein